VKKIIPTLWLTMISSISVLALQHRTVEQEKAALPGFKTYLSKNLGIEFNYPKILKVWEEKKSGIVVIEHRISFEYQDPCNGSVLRSRSKKILDFYSQISILHLTPTEVFRQEVMEKNEAGLITGVRNSVRVTYGELDGFRVYNGEHGCGPFSYFFQLAPQKVLKVDRWPSPEFAEISVEEKQIFSRLRQILLPENEEHIFREILTSLKWGIQ